MNESTPLGLSPLKLPADYKGQADRVDGWFYWWRRHRNQVLTP